MLSRLIVTFLCAAAIGSVSGAFVTFEPDPVVFKNTDISTSVSVRLSSKPTEEVKVYFEHSSLFMSTCMIVFKPNDWDVPQKISVMIVPAPFNPSNPLKKPESKSELLAKAVTVGPLPADLSSTDVLKITQLPKDSPLCSIDEGRSNTFDGLIATFNKLGWYQVVSTGDLEIQILWGECGEKRTCFTAVVFRYGPTVMSMDTRGPVKGIDEYSMTQVTPNTNTLQYTFGSKPGLHRTTFPCGSKLNVGVRVSSDGIVSLYVFLSLVAGYTSPRGLCNIPRSESLDNKLIGSDGKLYSREKEGDKVAFVDSWGIKDENVLTNPAARALIPPPQQPGIICKFPKDLQPKPVDPVQPPPTTTTTTTTTTTETTTTETTTTGLSTHASSSTVTSTTATPYSASTSPSTTSTTTSSTSTIYPLPPAPGGYIPPPPPPPPPDVIVEIQKCCQSIFNIPSCNAIVPTESYIQSCISDAQTSGSYVLSDKVKQAYLAKCHTLTDDMIRGTTKEVIDQGTKIRKEYGFGNGTCINSCSGKEQMEQHAKLPVSVPYATSAPSVPSVPSVDQSLASL
ncbi:hypothetical protein BASA83_010634 [Batrachochytrium salamandrivorans]|nr:hypothetical protein BASA83_010634 [Batrachochytrium salamandrivorans]